MSGEGQCSPLAKKEFKQNNNSCFTMEALQKFRDVYNADQADPRQRIPSGLTRNKLWDALDARMASKCRSGNETCWVDKLSGAASSPLVSKRVRPKKPAEWYKNRNAWLSNYDIQAVMHQYEDLPDNFYKFLGVFSIDFAETDALGHCVVDTICSINVFQLNGNNANPANAANPAKAAKAAKPRSKRTYKYVGLITNLDKHDEPGSHWTSLFICIDPSLPSYGAHYYDSTSSPPPKEMKAFMTKLKAQAHAAYPNRPFRIAFSKKKDQYGNNECGVFSMVYQIRWLHALRSKPNTVLKDIVQANYTDDDMNKIAREMLFRPNSNAVKPSAL